MAILLRPHRKRRRALASPLVVTALLGSGCGVNPTTESPRPAPQPEPPAVAGAGPVEQAEPPLQEVPGGAGTWTQDPESGAWHFAYESGSKAYLTPNGDCVFEPDRNCGGSSPGVPRTCNPPSPYEVKGPPALPSCASTPKCQ